MPEWLNLSLQVLIILGMLIGLIGQIIPFFPGIPIIWLSILGYGLMTGFTWKSGIIFGVITALMLFSTVVDNILMGASARQKGTSWLAIGIGALTMVVASLFLTPLVGLLAAFAAIFLVEFLRRNDWRAALTSLKSLIVGFGWTILARLAIGLVMIGLWLIWYLILI
jgi:uncharacterized protein YqgC (DUF456 family)